jgi:RNA polymerase sigma-70 factor (ECF subfamily)
MNGSDSELVLLYRDDGSELAMTTLVNRYVSLVYNLIVRLVGDRREAEDLTQETFMKMWKALSRFDTEKNFKTWIFAIARNTAIDYLRKKKPILFSRLNSENDEGETRFEDNLADDAILADEAFDRKQSVGALEKAMQTLSLDERVIIILHESDEMTFEEIADVMSKPMNTIKSRYRRALQKLRGVIESGAPKAGR